MSYDPLRQWHKDKAKASYDEAFNTPTYATGMWKCESESERAVEMFKNLVVAGFTAGVIGGSIYVMAKFLP